MILKLYNYWRSSSAWRVRIALAVKNIPFEYVAVHLTRGGGEQHQASFVAISTLGQVPVLEWQEATEVRRVTQSLAICDYLESIKPEPPLLPADSYLASKTLQLAEIINSGIQPLQNLTVMNRLAAQCPSFAKEPWARDCIKRGFDGLEPEIAATAGKFSVGHEVTLADICLIPQMYNARRFGVDLTPYPTLRRIDSTCSELKPFQEAHPDAQPDAPPADGGDS